MERCSCDTCKKVWDGNQINPTKIYVAPVEVKFTPDEFPNVTAWGDSASVQQLQDVYQDLQSTQRQLSLRNAEVEALQKQITDMVARTDYETLLNCYDEAIAAMQDAITRQSDLDTEYTLQQEELRLKDKAIEELKSVIVTLAKHL